MFGQSSFSKLWCTLSHSFLKAWESEEDAREQEPVEIIEIKPVSREFILYLPFASRTNDNGNFSQL